MGNRTPRGNRRAGGSSLRVQRPVIVWAVDPFHDDLNALKHSAAILLPFARALQMRIQPLCFVDSYRANPGGSQRFPLIPVASEIPQLLEERAIESMKPLYRGALARVLLPIHLLHHDEAVPPTTLEKVAALQEHALALKTPFVAVRSHARRGLSRFFMGSFAETFLLHSSVPTLFINPAGVPSRQIRRAMFATDFDSGSRRALHRALPLLRDMKVSLTVVHHRRIERLSPLFEDAASRKQVQEESGRARVRIEKAAAGFVGLAERKNLPAAFQLIEDTRGEGCAASLVLLGNQCGCDLMVMAAKSSALVDTFVGATSRQVARMAPFPVLLLRTQR